MSDRLLPASSLFRIATPCYATEQVWGEEGVELDAVHQIGAYSVLDGKHPYADLRIAWSRHGLYLTLEVTRRREPVWCRMSRWEDSDGLSLWVATRDVSQVYRANRFCHRFVLLPEGDEIDRERPFGTLMSVARAREAPKAVPASAIQVRSVVRDDGYLLQAYLSSEAMTGFDVSEQRALGFYYAVADREHGWQTFSMGNDSAFESDPSLWGVLELVDAP